MHISWLGGTTIKLQTKPLDKDLTIIIDPYRYAVGTSPRNLGPDIALLTRGEKDAITLSGSPFILITPGECDIHGVLVTAVEGHEEGTTMIRVDTEQLSLAHLGAANKPLTDKQREVVGDVDILCIGVGGPESGTYYHHEAIDVINELEPRIVIPMAFQSDNNPDAKPIEKFLKEMGIADGKPEAKVIIKKKDLPEEETRVIVLSKE